ncbi:polymeric immunoglobulin receptor-like isoform X1, partial [Clarias magur]
STTRPHGASKTTASSSPVPGRNFTISISGLTVEDEGDYECRDKNRPNRFIAVHLRAEVNLPFVPFALVTAIVLHIIVAVVYCSTRKK